MVVVNMFVCYEEIGLVVIFRIDELGFEFENVEIWLK